MAITDGLILQYNLGLADLLPTILPDGYTPIAYIESHADSYFDSGLAVTANLYAESKFSFLSHYSHNMVFGVWNNFAFSTRSETNGLCVGMGGTEIQPATDITYYDGDIIELLMGPKIGGYKVNGKLHSLGGSSNNATSNTIRVCGCLSSWYFNGKLYYLRFYDGNTLKRNFIPCTNSSGVAGMYDTVGRTFYSSATSTAFIAGPEIVQGLPEEYLLVEYILATGTQYLKLTTSLLTSDTINTTVIVDSWNPVNGFESSIAGSDHTNVWQIYYTTSNTVGTYGCYSNITPTAGTTGILNQRTKFTGTITSTNSLWYIFRYRESGNIHDLRGKIEVFTISRSSNIILNLVPCYRKYDMKPGMFDVVNQVFYTNSGTGEFILGPTINERSCIVNAGHNIVGTYDTNYYTEPDGSTWIRIFHHNNPYNNGSGNLFSSSDNFLSVYKDANRWSDLLQLNNVVSWELMIKQKATSSSAELKFRFVLSANPLIATSSATVTYNTASGYTIATSSKGPLVKVANSNTYLDSATNSWWGAFGVCTSWSTYLIPGWNGTSIGTGYSDLYLRVPSTCGIPVNLHSIYDNSKGWVALGNTYNNYLYTTSLPFSSLTNCTLAIWYNSNGNIILPFNGLSTSYYLGATDSTHTWHANAGSPTLYEDGNSVTKFSVDSKWHLLCFKGANISSWTMLKIHAFDSSWSKNCYWTNVMIWNRALSDSEIKQLAGG